MSCPVAYPLAWSARDLYPCRGGALHGRVPANDCPAVRPRARAGVPRDDFPSNRGSDLIAEQPGVVICCPLAGPLASPARPAQLLPYVCPVPPNVGRNRLQTGRAHGGGS